MAWIGGLNAKPDIEAIHWHHQLNRNAQRGKINQFHTLQSNFEPLSFKDFSIFLTFFILHFISKKFVKRKWPNATAAHSPNFHNF